MFRLLNVCGIVAALLMVLISCEVEQPTQSSGLLSEKPLTISISQLDSSVFADEGELYPIAFEVSVTDSSDYYMQNVPLFLSVSSGPGDVAPTFAFTDSSGILEALYYLTVPPGDTTSVISISTGDDSVSAEIRIHGDQIPVAVRMTPEPEKYVIKRGKGDRGYLCTKIIDSRGIGVPNQKVIYTINRGIVVLHGLERTDSSGVIMTDVILSGDWSGELVISASVVTDSDKNGHFAHLEPPGWLTKLGIIPRSHSGLSAYGRRGKKIENRVVIHVKTQKDRK